MRNRFAVVFCTHSSLKTYKKITSSAFFFFTSRQMLIHQITSQGQLPAGAVLSEIRLQTACVSHASCQLVAEWSRTDDTKDLSSTWPAGGMEHDMSLCSCHIHLFSVTFTFSVFIFTFQAFKSAECDVKSWKMNNSLNNKSCSRAFYSDRSWKIWSWKIWGGGGGGQTECPALSSPLMLRLFLFNAILRWYFPHFVFTLNKFVHSDAKFYRTNGCWWLFKFNSAKVRACKCSLNV